MSANTADYENEYDNADINHLSTSPVNAEIVNQLNQQLRDDESVDKIDVNHLSTSPANVEFIAQLNQQLRDEEAIGKATPPTMPTCDDLAYPEYEPTYNVEAEILRDTLYQEVLDEVARTEFQPPASHIHAASSYDHVQSTVMLRLNGLKALLKALFDTGAGVDLIREDAVPNGSIRKSLKRPVFMAGFNGDTAERVSELAKIAVQTEDGAEFKYRWFYVVKSCNYDVILSKGWLNDHQCHWEMSSAKDRVSLMSENQGRITLDSKELQEKHPSMNMVKPLQQLKTRKFLEQEIDGEIVGRLILTEDLEVKARMGEVPELKVRFVPETTGSE
jgi:hypothetical protein